MNTENLVLKQVANEVVTKDHIIGYLDVVKNNLNMSVLNQAMIYLQRPHAKMVCGKKAWESMERTIKSDTLPVVLFFPTLRMTEPPEEYEVDGVPQVVGDTNVSMNKKEPVFKHEYIPVNAFDFDSTEGNIIPDNTPHLESFSEAIMDITGASIENVPLENMDKVNGYKYDKEQNVIYISDDFKSDKEYTRALIDALLAYIFYSHQLNDKCLKAAIKYVISEHYDIPNNIAASLFTKLNEKSEEEKLDFLYLLQYYTSNIVQDFEGYYLTFNETAFINDIYDTANPSDIQRSFDKVILSIEDDFLKDELAGLRSKLLRADSECLEELLSLRANKEIYTYPPHEIKLDKTDYLKDAREKLLNEAEFASPSQI